MKLEKLKSDRNGSVEGIPLQFMIMMIVAVAAVGILGGWMANISTPQSISDVEVTSGVATWDSDAGEFDKAIEILVRDQDGNPLDGATVILEGLGAQIKESGSEPATYKKAVLTTEDGKVSFEGLSITPPKGGFGTLSVNVLKSGYGEFNSTEIVVVVD